MSSLLKVDEILKEIGEQSVEVIGIDGSVRYEPAKTELSKVGGDVFYHYYQIMVAKLDLEMGRGHLKHLLDAHKHSMARMGFRAVNIMSVTPDDAMAAWVIKIQCVLEEGELYEVLEGVFEEDIMPQIMTRGELIIGNHFSQKPKAAGSTLGEIVARRKLQAVI
jgi:hypothetical protein